MSQQHLHLDLSVGARAEMLIGALLAVGAPRAAALEALGQVGLVAVGLEEVAVRRGALNATAAHLLIPGEGVRVSAEVRPSARGTRRGRTAQARRTAVLHTPSQAAIADAAAMPVPGALSLPAPPVPPRAERVVEAWLAGAPARVLDLPHWVASSALPAVTKALAHKAARRLAAALVAVAGGEARLGGVAAVRVLAELTAVAALVDALSPAAITATPIAISAAASSDDGVVDGLGWPAPSPWLLAILAGVPLIEHDRPWASVDPAGAACAWALVHRFGARGVTGFARQGIGAAQLEAPAGCLVARALVGPPVPVATRAGECSAEPCAALSASLPADAATPALVEELRARGAHDVRLLPELAPLGARPRLTVSLSSPPAAMDTLCEALWGAGATDVVRTWADRWTPGLVEVTVPVGRGTTKASVRVRVTSSAGRILRVEPELDDVRVAARRARRSEHAIAAEAAAAAMAQATGRVGGGQGGEGSEGGEGNDDGR